MISPGSRNHPPTALLTCGPHSSYDPLQCSFRSVARQPRQQGQPVRTSLLHLYLAMAATLRLTSCAIAPPPGEMKQVAERNCWELAHWGDRAVPDGVAAPPVILAFQDGRVSGHAGCNRYAATISFGPKAGDLTVSHGMTTRMACEPRRMEFEAAFIEAFEASRRYRLDGERLSLESEVAPPLEFYRRPVACQESPFSACGETHDIPTPR